MSGDDRDYSKQPLPWSGMYPESTAGYRDAFGEWHPGNAPDMGESAPLPAGSTIAKQTAAEEAKYRRRLDEVARFMAEGRESVRAGGPGADWEGWKRNLDKLHRLAQEEHGRTPLSRVETNGAQRSAPERATTPLPQAEPVSDAIGRRLLARWRRHR